MKRKITEQMLAWKADKNKKALLITGARQIGKTYIIREFGKTCYQQFAEINFLEQETAAKIFAMGKSADEIIANLTAFLSMELPVAKTLIFLDEIQECPDARTAIKFLVDDGRFDYIESGSLLGVKYKEVKSYPVGYEQQLQMFPMDFEEFLVANGIQPDTLTHLRNCYEQKIPVSSSMHDRLCQLFRYYMIVGGMPDVVKIFIESHDIGRVIRLQKDILELYRQDISKYASRDSAKIKMIFDSIPAELNSKNKRFLLSDLAKTARMDRYEEGFLWLRDAGVALPCYNVSEPTIPLCINEKHNLFKLFLADTGLICAASLENVQFDILQGNLNVNMGSILENLFAQALTANGFELRYYDKKNKGELDFCVQRGQQVIPIEVKSGHSYREHPALSFVLQSETWNIPQGIVFCGGNVEEDGKILYLPWYMVIFFTQERIPEGMTVDVDLSGL